eukprot:Polyplicarium_translucidae@DN3068_c0_g2_i5.p1
MFSRFFNSSKATEALWKTVSWEAVMTQWPGKVVPCRHNSIEGGEKLLAIQGYCVIDCSLHVHLVDTPHVGPCPRNNKVTSYKIGRLNVGHDFFLSQLRCPNLTEFYSEQFHPDVLDFFRRHLRQLKKAWIPGYEEDFRGVCGHSTWGFPEEWGHFDWRFVEACEDLFPTAFARIPDGVPSVTAVKFLC